jgi:integrase
MGINGARQKRFLIKLHDARRDAAFVAKLGSIGWHTFRHKYRTLLSRADTPLDVQQKLLRHADIRTTTQYGELPDENKRQQRRGEDDSEPEIGAITPKTRTGRKTRPAR